MNNIKEAITDRWENSANGYDTYIQGEINTFKEKGWRDLILSEFEQDKLNILDIDTGPGFFSLILSKEGHKLTGIDCKKNCKNTNSEFYVMDSHKLDFSDNSFDIIVCRNVTWTLYNPKKAYKEWTRVLKPGGKIGNVNYLGEGDYVDIPRVEWGCGMSHKSIAGGLMPGGRLRMEKLASLLETKKLDTSKLITHTFNSFEKVEDALYLMKDKPKDLIKPIVIL